MLRHVRTMYIVQCTRLKVYLNAGDACPVQVVRVLPSLYELVVLNKIGIKTNTVFLFILNLNLIL